MSLCAVVFSFDRAAQLELLLRSLRENAAEFSDFSISVLFKASDADADAAYAEVAEAFPSVVFAPELPVTELALGAQILHLIDRQPREYFAFFVDDDVVIRAFSTRDREFERLREPDRLALSLRLHPLVFRCQPTGAFTRPPIMGSQHSFSLARPRPFGSKRLGRNWQRLSAYPRGDWACRFSVDGNVYRTDRFREHFASQGPFPNVTEIEPILCRQRGWGDRIGCYSHPRLVNVAMNRVDSRYAYPSAEVSPKEMNERFRSGLRLDYRHLQGRRFRSCHLLQAPVWTSSS